MLTVHPLCAEKLNRSAQFSILLFHDEWWGCYRGGHLRTPVPTVSLVKWTSRRPFVSTDRVTRAARGGLTRRATCASATTKRPHCCNQRLDWHIWNHFIPVSAWNNLIPRRWIGWEATTSVRMHSWYAYNTFFFPNKLEFRQRLAHCSSCEYALNNERLFCL